MTGVREFKIPQWQAWQKVTGHSIDLYFNLLTFYWAAHGGNTQSRNELCLCQKKTKWQMELPEGFECPIPTLVGRFLQGGDGLFQVLWSTDMEVHRVIGPISTWNDYLNIVFDVQELQKQAALPRSPREKPSLV